LRTPNDTSENGVLPLGKPLFYPLTMGTKYDFSFVSLTLGKSPATFFLAPTVVVSTIRQESLSFEI
jgi:hypothetical protein